MEVFINELSIQEQYNNITDFTKAVVEFTKVVSNLNDVKCNSDLYKKGDFYHINKAIPGEDFRSSLNKIRDKLIKTSFQSIVFNKNNPKDWRKNQHHLASDRFKCLNLQCDVTGQTLAEVSERKLGKAEGVFLMLNFKDSSFIGNNTSVEKNTTNTITLDCVNDVLQIKQWLKKNCIEELFVKNTDNFEKTTKQIKGATIYKEKLTGYYWYIDTLHKTHYEVFDSNGNHLGESNFDGKLDATKIDSSKNGKIDI